MKPQAIKATDEWLNALKELPYKSRKLLILSFLIVSICIEKNGKTLYLLKQSSKIISSKKKRKVVPLLGTIKDYHAARQNATVIPQLQTNQS